MNKATPQAAREIAMVGHSSTLLLRSAAAFLKSFASRCPWPLRNEQHKDDESFPAVLGEI